MNEEKPSGHEAPASGTCICMGAGPVISQLVKNLGPDEAVRAHFRNARVEFLKGLREMLDKRISELSKTPQPKGSRVIIE